MVTDKVEAFCFTFEFLVFFSKTSLFFVGSRGESYMLIISNDERVNVILKVHLLV